MNDYNPRETTGEQFAKMLDICISGRVATVAFPTGKKARGTLKSWMTDSSIASQELISASGGYFNLVACARERIESEFLAMTR